MIAATESRRALIEAQLIGVVARLDELKGAPPRENYLTRLLEVLRHHADSLPERVAEELDRYDGKGDDA